MRSFRDLERHFGATRPEIISALSTIDRASGRQEAFAQQNPERLEVLRHVARIQSTEASNAIENIRASRQRIEKLVQETADPKNRDEREIAGYRFVLDTIHNNAHEIGFEPKFVEQLHQYMARFTGHTWAGKWKKLDNAVEEELPDDTTVTRFEPVSAVETPGAMEELHKRFNEERASGTYHHLLLTAAYILDFTVIHPFQDGNGRMSRLITLWLLYLGDYNVGRYVSLEKIIDESRKSYYEVLKASTDGWHEGKHDLRPWTEYFLGLLNAAYKEFEARVDAVASVGSKRELVERCIATSLKKEFSLADIRKGCPGVSDSYIKQVLRELKDKKIVAPKGTGRGAKWERLRDDFLDGPA